MKVYYKRLKEKLSKLQMKTGRILSRFTVKQKVFIIVFLFVVGGIVFSNRTGYYYPIVGKEFRNDYYVIGEKKGKCETNWDMKYQGRSRRPSVEYCSSEYKRYGNVVIMDSGQYVCIGFWYLTVMIEPENKQGENVALFYKRNDKRITRN